jgi:hypothetical protein
VSFLFWWRGCLSRGSAREETSDGYKCGLRSYPSSRLCRYIPGLFVHEDADLSAWLNGYAETSFMAVDLVGRRQVYVTGLGSAASIRLALPFFSS